MTVKLVARQSSRLQMTGRTVFSVAFSTSCSAFCAGESARSYSDLKISVVSFRSVFVNGSVWFRRRNRLYLPGWHESHELPILRQESYMTKLQQGSRNMCC